MKVLKKIKNEIKDNKEFYGMLAIGVGVGYICLKAENRRIYRNCTRAFKNVLENYSLDVNLGERYWEDMKEVLNAVK